MELDGAAKWSVTSLRCLGWEELSVWYRAVRFLCHPSSLAVTVF